MLKNKIRRFSTYRIAEHWIYMTTFIVLAVTGLSQKFHSLDISLWLIFHLGGIDYVRLIHRYAGMVFLVVTAFHIITGIVCIAAKVYRYRGEYIHRHHRLQRHSHSLIKAFPHAHILRLQQILQHHNKFKERTRNNMPPMP